MRSKRRGRPDIPEEPDRYAKPEKRGFDESMNRRIEESKKQIIKTFTIMKKLDPEQKQTLWTFFLNLLEMIFAIGRKHIDDSSKDE